MKNKLSKFFALCVCCVLSLSMIACTITTNNENNDNTENNVNGNNATIQCVHQWVDADCENPKTCSKCNETVGVKLGHTTSTGKCTRCNKNFGSWEKGEFVDEFKQPTGKKYIATRVNGSFSNSATTNSDLIAALQITTDDVAIMLWEYGWNSVKCSYKWDDYTITMKDTNGTKHYLDGTMYSGSSRIYIDDSDKSTVINALKKSGTVSFYIVLSDRTTTNYLFTVETSNFKDIYAET